MLDPFFPQLGQGLPEIVIRRQVADAAKLVPLPGNLEVRLGKPLNYSQ